MAMPNYAAGSTLGGPIGNRHQRPADSAETRAPIPYPYNILTQHGWYEDFRPSAPPDSASLYDQSAAGTPTEADQAVSGGVRKFSLASTNEIEIVGWDEANVATFKPTGQPVAFFRLAFSAIATNENGAFGFISARPAGIAGLAARKGAMFTLGAAYVGGSLALNCQTYDGTTLVQAAANDGDGAITLVADTYYYFRVDMADLGAVKFYYGANPYDMRKVGSLAASALVATDLLMPFGYIMKTSGTGVSYLLFDLTTGHGCR